MDNLKSLKGILLTYSDELKNLFGDNFSVNITDSNITITTECGDTYKVSFSSCDYECQFVRSNENETNIITLHKRDSNGIVMVSENKIIKLDGKYLVDIINRQYGKSRFNRKKDALLDVYNISYVINGNVDIKELTNLEYLDIHSTTKAEFSAHMKTFAQIPGEARSFTDSIYPSYVFFNKDDVSKTYGFIDGIDKISIIFDIYSGNINSRNYKDLRCIILGLDDKDGFGLKYKKIFNEDELRRIELEGRLSTIDISLAAQLVDEKIGSLRKFDPSKISSLIDLFGYELSATEHAKLSVEKALGIPYAQFDGLDFDEQQKLIREYHKNNPQKDDNTVLIMHGSGETASFERVKKGTKVFTPDGYYIAGETIEEAEERINKKIDDMINPKSSSIFQRVLRRIIK